MEKILFPLHALPQAYNEVVSWISEICPSNRIEYYVTCDHNEKLDSYTFSFYTKEHRYVINARPYSTRESLSRDGKVIGASNYPAYLGATGSCRKPRAGESWNRGNDLPDGKYSRETWERIKNAIITYELVRVSKQKGSVPGTPYDLNSRNYGKDAPEDPIAEDQLTKSTLEDPLA